MFKRIVQWWQQKQCNRGFEFAAGVLLRGDQTRTYPQAYKYLLDNVAISRTFGTYGSFEEGVELAVSCFENIRRAD